ncbi:MAG: anti-sigma factor [Alphaproteobacteria bacterium]|nr:anti-sigma factor [Alphaproteobacteria bacterium]
MRQEVVHHPSGEFLIDYASGSASEAVSLLVATHLALCPVCRHDVAALETVGSQALEPAGAEPAPMAILPASVPHAEAKRPAVGGDMLFPEPLRSYLGRTDEGLPWSRPLIGPAEVVIPVGDERASVKLLRIRAGRAMPRHTHEGNELTLVLQGNFRDQGGLYRRGDVACADALIDHTPRAGSEADCICLAVVDAPLLLTGRLAGMARRLLG